MIFLKFFFAEKRLRECHIKKFFQRLFMRNFSVELIGGVLEHVMNRRRLFQRFRHLFEEIHPRVHVASLMRFRRGVYGAF